MASPNEAVPDSTPVPIMPTPIPAATTATETEVSPMEDLSWVHDGQKRPVISGKQMAEIFHARYLDDLRRECKSKSKAGKKAAENHSNSKKKKQREENKEKARTDEPAQKVKCISLGGAENTV